MKLKKVAGILIIMAFAALLSAYLANQWFEKESSAEIKREHISNGSVNAIKHAYAASLVYFIIRDIGIGKNAAEKIVIILGNTNEIAERIFFQGKHKDSTLEIIKDLHNNYVGIKSAKWLEDNKDKYTRLNLIAKLARDKILIISANEYNLENIDKSSLIISSDPLLAMKWFEKNKYDIDKKVDEWLGNEGR